MFAYETAYNAPKNVFLAMHSYKVAKLTLRARCTALLRDTWDLRDVCNKKSPWAIILTRTLILPLEKCFASKISVYNNEADFKGLGVQQSGFCTNPT